MSDKQSKQNLVLSNYFLAVEALLNHERAECFRSGLQPCHELAMVEEMRLDFIAEFCRLDKLGRPEVSAW